MVFGMLEAATMSPSQARVSCPCCFPFDPGSWQEPAARCAVDHCSIYSFPDPWADPKSRSTLGLYNLYHRCARVWNWAVIRKYTLLYHTIIYHTIPYCIKLPRIGHLPSGVLQRLQLLEVDACWALQAYTSNPYVFMRTYYAYMLCVYRYTCIYIECICMHLFLCLQKVFYIMQI